MNYRRTITALFVLAALTPILGIPPSWKTPLIGLFLLTGSALFLYDRYYLSRVKDNGEDDVFLNNTQRAFESQDINPPHDEVDKPVDQTSGRANWGGPSAEEDKDQKSERGALSAQAWREKANKTQDTSPLWKQKDDE